MLIFLVVLLLKTMTVYAVRISDWRSDVCSSDLQRDVGIRHDLSLAVLPDRIGSLVSGEYAQVAHDGFRYFQRLSVAAARDFLCQDEIDSVARKDKPGNRTLRGYRQDRKSTRLNSSH